MNNNTHIVTFTGKELDEETGYGYFGARYMDHELMTMWLSVDPMADKYPSISPYAYCVWNPVKLVDPDGRDGRVIIHNERGKRTITIETTIYLTTNSPDKMTHKKLNRLAKNYTFMAKRFFKQKIINGTTVLFNIKYEVLKESTVIRDGDNVMSLNPNTPGRSETPYEYETDQLTGIKLKETTGNRSNINEDDLGAGAYRGVLHETGHLLGLSDRYYDDNTSFKGFEKDLMGGNARYSFGLDESHYQNYIDYYMNKDMGSASFLLLDMKIDIQHTNNLIHKVSNPEPTIY